MFVNMRIGLSFCVVDFRPEISNDFNQVHFTCIYICLNLLFNIQESHNKTKNIEQKIEKHALLVYIYVKNRSTLTCNDL